MVIGPGGSPVSNVPSMSKLTKIKEGAIFEGGWARTGPRSLADVASKRAVPAGVDAPIADTDEIDVSPSTFASLKVPTFRTLWTAGVIVFLAVQAKQIARGALAHEIPRSNAGLGEGYFR